MAVTAEPVAAGVPVVNDDAWFDVKEDGDRELEGAVGLDGVE